MLSNISTLFKRETAAYFNAAIAYIFIIVFVLLNGGLFMTQFFLIGRADLRPFFSTLPFLLAVFIPAITMRQWAEERRGNTLELLLTFPMPTQHLVIGKFLSGFIFYLIALACTLPLAIMVKVLGNPDMGVVFSGYFGAILLGGFYLAIGIFISGLCRDQIVAFILSMVIAFGLHLLGTEFFATSIDGWLPGFGSFLRQYLGSAPHYESFSKGVVDNRDVLYFAIGAAIFLVLNGFWLEGRMRLGAQKMFISGAVICVGIFLMANWLFSGIGLGRFDLTEAQIYTISPATKKIIRNLKTPVTAKLYISPQDKMPTGMKTIEQDIVGKFEELHVHSKGKFQYKILHMEAANIASPDLESETESLEEKLQKKGIQPFQVQAVESDEVAVRLIYSSIGLSYKEKTEEIIPQIIPAKLHELEYTLASKIYRMTLEKTPRIAIVAPYQEKQVEPEVAALLAQLGGKVPEGYREDHYETLELALNYDGYDIDRILLTEEEPIDEGVDTLVVIEPRELTERQRYEINRFLVSGGSVFMAVQNYDYQYSMQGRQDLQVLPVQKNPGVNSLLLNWGLEVDSKILADEDHDMISLGGGARMGPFAMSVPVKIPIQILVKSPNMNDEVSITSHLSPIFYLWGTAIKANEKKLAEQDLRITTLFKSSKNSWRVPFKADLIGPTDLFQSTNSEPGPFSLAVIVEGQFNDAYADKDIPKWSVATEETDEEESMSEDVSIAPHPGKLILTGASSFLQKHLVTGGGNLSFFMNSIDALTLGEDLVTIRSKRPVDRTLSRTSAASKVGWRLFVTLFIPFIIAIVGTLRVFLRKKTKQDYLKNYSKA